MVSRGSLVSGHRGTEEDGSSAVVGRFPVPSACGFGRPKPRIVKMDHQFRASNPVPIKERQPSAYPPASSFQLRTF